MHCPKVAHPGGEAGFRAGFSLLLLLWSAQALAGQPDIPDAPEIPDDIEQMRYQDPALVLSRIDAAIDALSPERHSDELAELLHVRAGIYRDRGDLALALADIEAIDVLAARVDNPVMAADALHMRGTLMAEQGKLAAALEQFHAARRLLEESDDRRKLARVTIAIGVVHNFSDNHERAAHYLDEALGMARDIGDEGLEATVLGNRAVAAAELEGAEAALAWHQQSLAIAERRDYVRTAAYQLGNMCRFKVQLGHLQEAESVCHRGVEALEALGQRRLLASTRMALGDLYLAQGREDQALAEFQSVLAAADHGIPSVVLPVLNRLADLHEARGEFAEAASYLRRKVNLREREIEGERREILEELELRYQVEQQERELEVLRLDAELQAVQLRQRNWTLYGLSGFFTVFALLMALSWNNYRSKTHANRRLAREDSLTGLFNRRAFLDLAGHEQSRARREKSTTTLVVADIDAFKPVNDSHGHQVGDSVLKQVANRVSGALREVDIICRWGGEEFVFLLPDTDLEGARHAVERVRQALAREPLTTEAGPLTVTLTYGLTVLGEDINEAINRADEAMYEGKRRGRDRLVVHGE